MIVTYKYLQPSAYRYHLKFLFNKISIETIIISKAIEIYIVQTLFSTFSFLK